MVIDDDAFSLPIDGTLDLHAFHPRDIATLVPDYLEACREQGVLEVRIVHGKGRGVLRRGVLAVLARTPGILDVRSAGVGRGDWGATIVRLTPKPAR